jgi:hypothetical protein
MPHRHRFFSAHRALLRQEEGVNQGSLALERQEASEGLELHRRVAFLLNRRVNNQPLQLAKVSH